MSEDSVRPSRLVLPRLVGLLRYVSGAHRSEAANIRLGVTLCFVAGAANAGGFVAVGQYTSHMSGIVSAIADNAALGDAVLLLGGLGALLSFALGAATSAVLVNWGRRHHKRSRYALPLLIEAALMLGFGLAGAARHEIPHFLVVSVPMLCFMMGLQNAMVTKISQARIRTTHVTGMVTDLGIELGKLCYALRLGGKAGIGAVEPVRPDMAKLRLLATLLGTFFLGGLCGAVGFKTVGFVTTLPLALILLVLAGIPVADDVLALRQSRQAVAARKRQGLDPG